MAIDINAWLKRYPDLNKEQILKWSQEISVVSARNDVISDYIHDRYELMHNPGLDQQFNDKWQPIISGQQQPPAAEPEDVEPEPEAQPEDDGDGEILPGRPIEDDEEDVELDEDADDELPFDNPDLGDVDNGFDDEGDDDVPETPMDNIRQRPKPALRSREPEYIRQQVTKEEYEEKIRPFMPYVNAIKEDPKALVSLAQMIEPSNPPPYMQLRSMIINNPCKDINNKQLLINVIDENYPSRTIMAWKTLPEAIDISRELAAKAFYEAYLNNFNSIIDTYGEITTQLISNIVLLEVYCENRQDHSIFDVHIPKERLTKTITEAFGGIDEAIRTLVMAKLNQMHVELKGEVGDLSTTFQKNIGTFDQQISAAVEKVMWKVKTDVEQTNLEDIKRAQLYVLNKRAESYTMQAPCAAIMAILCDDFERRLIKENYIMDNIKEYRRYTMTELQKRLGYKVNTIITKAIPKLIKAKMISSYDDGSVSLSK